MTADNLVESELHPGSSAELKNLLAVLEAMAGDLRPGVRRFRGQAMADPLPSARGMQNLHTPLVLRVAGLHERASNLAPQAEAIDDTASDRWPRQSRPVASALVTEAAAPRGDDR